MDINTLIDNPHYDRLVELAKMYNLDMGIMQEMAMGVTDRLEALMNRGIEIEEAHIMAAVQSWFTERQAITERYFNDRAFQVKVQGQVYDQLKAGA